MINVSEGGLLVQDFRLPVGSRITFGLEGPVLKCRGRGYVTRHCDEGAAIAVEEWAGSVPALRELVTAGLLAEATWRDLYVSSWP